VTAGVYTTRADRMHYRNNDKPREVSAYCKNRFHLKSLLISFTIRRTDILDRVGKERERERERERI